MLTTASPGTASQDFATRYVFDALEAARIPYALLRGHDELQQAGQDIEIDLLVDGKSVDRLGHELAGFGFTELPAWGHAPHRFFVSFSKAAGHWIKLDIVSDLYYGRPIRKYRLNLAAECLQNRRQEDVFLLSEPHEFLTTLLHCLLDKGHFRPKHQRRLHQLWLSLQNDDHAARTTEELIADALGPALTWSAASRLLEASDWDSLLLLAPAIERLLAGRSPMRGQLRQGQMLFLRRIRPLFFAFRRRGVSAALLAPDGAGKSTLAGSLVQDKFLRARLIYMGTNVAASTVGLPFTPYLVKKAKAAKEKKISSAPVAILFRALNLVNNIFEHWYRCLVARYHLLRGRFVIFDRFIYDSWIQERKKSLWKRFRYFLFDAPSPDPDLVLLLDAPGEILFARKGEHSAEWIDRQRAGYMKLKPVLPQMTVIDASQDADTVKNEATYLIWNSYRKAGMRSELNGSHR